MSDRLGPDFDGRLRAELDRFQPPTPLPQSARFSQARVGSRRFGRMQLALAMAGVLAVLTVVAASAASGTDPGTWPQRAVTTVESVTHVGESSPPPSPEKVPQTEPRPPAQAEPSKTKATQQERESPKPSEDSRSGRESPEATLKQSHDQQSPPSPSSDEGDSRSRSSNPSEN